MNRACIVDTVDECPLAALIAPAVGLDTHALRQRLYSQRQAQQHARLGQSAAYLLLPGHVAPVQWGAQ